MAYPVEFPRCNSLFHSSSPSTSSSAAVFCPFLRHCCRYSPFSTVSPSPRVPLTRPSCLRLQSTSLSGRLTLRRPRGNALLRLVFVSSTGEKLGSPNDADETEEGPASANGTSEPEVVIAQAESQEQKRQRQGRNLRDRVVFGMGIGFGTGGVVLAGGWPFAVAVAAASLVVAREYFEMVRSRGIAMGMTPPPRFVSRVCSVICALLPLFTLYFGHIDVSITSFAFVIAMALFLQRGNPRFAQLTSAVFGLFYCGYLPCFWIKLRCLSVPALNTKFATTWPILLGGPPHWTVGLIATLLSISSIIAADTFAFMGGKVFGRTPFTSVSPRKTLEGALAGLIGCVLITMALSNLLSWPTSLMSALAYGILNFIGSLFGDLIESVIKRDAGVKDSGSLIPGHGGALDRLDSYVFTGALSYSFIKTMLPLYGI